MAGLFAFFRGARTPTAEHPVPTRITALDERVERWVAPRRSKHADRVFYGLSSAADHGLLWLCIGAARAAVVPKHRKGLVRLAVAMGAESALTNGVLKSVFRRVRPIEYYDDTPLPYGMHRPITTAFPSGHAASAFTAATLLAEDDPLAPAYYALAGVVAASRVYVRMHYASDVVAGTAWGLLLGRVIRKRFPVTKPGRTRR